MSRLKYISSAVRTKGFVLYLSTSVSFLGLAFRPAAPLPTSPTAQTESYCPPTDGCEPSYPIQEIQNFGIAGSPLDDGLAKLEFCYPEVETKAIKVEKKATPPPPPPTAPKAAVAQLVSKKPKERRAKKHIPTIDQTDFTYRDFDVFLRGFKLEEVLEVWIRKKGSLEYQYVKSYPFCQFSGRMGPKRMRGDLQIPEGFYYINRFNPKSKYHLSLGLNYPNTSDRILGNKRMLGGDIFIHGGCATIGCIPITDFYIEELYALVSEATQGGQKKIPVHIFPAKMEAYTMSKLNEGYPQHKFFWASLLDGYQHFEKTHQVPKIKVNRWGRYEVRS